MQDGHVAIASGALQDDMYFGTTQLSVGDLPRIDQPEKCFRSELNQSETYGVTSK
jgi:hypothetical protein